MRKCKIFFTAFILLMTLFILSVEVSAADTTINEGRFYYEVVDGEAIIRRVSSSGIKNLVIPETLGGYPVTEINMEIYAADIDSSVTAVTLPKTIKKLENINKNGEFKQVYVDNLETWLNINLGVYPSMYFNEAVLYVDGKAVTDVVVPDSVTEIGHYIFCMESFESVTFSESIQSVSTYAFDALSAEKIYVPDLETWFRICNISTPMYAEIYINNEIPVDIVIPENIDTIPAHAFEDFKIKSITFTNPIKNFGYNWVLPHNKVEAFYVDSFETWMNFEHDDELLYNVKCLYIDGEAVAGDYVFPETCTRITDKAFCNYKALENITLHAGIEHIGDHAFFGTGIENVYVDSLETWFKICDNIYKSNGRATYKANPMYSAKNLYVDGELLIDLVIPETITEIPVYGLYSIDTIKSVTFHNGVMSAGYGSFENCTNIKEVYVPNLETFIRVGVGVGNTLDTIYVDGEPLVNLVVPEGVTYLGRYLFEDYDKLESITFNHAGITIAKGCFSGCDNLKGVYADSLDTWFGIKFEDNTSSPMSIAKNLYINGSIVENLVFDETVTEIPEYAFMNCKSIKTVTLHDKITSFGIGAFSNCSAIERVYAPSIESWLSIDFATGGSNPLCNGADLYINGEPLVDFEIPETVSEIKPNAFFGYSGIKNLILSGKPVKMGVNAFNKCSEMQIQAGTIEDWLNVIFEFDVFTGYCNPMGYGATLNVGGSPVETVVIPESVESISSFAFQNCKTLRNVIIPATTTFGAQVFEGCTLNEVVIGSLTEKTEPIKEVSSAVFSKCSNIRKITFGYDVKSIGDNAFKSFWGLQEVVFYNGIESIGDRAFYETNIVSLTIPSTVKSIGVRAFAYNPSMTDVTFGNTEGVQESILEIGDLAFSNCNALKKVTLNSGIKKMGANVFYKTQKLEDVYINDFASYLGIEFIDFYGLGQNSNPAHYAENIYINGEIPKNVIIPEGVTRICNFAFAGCKTLETVKLPSTLKEIGTQAFVGCSNLQNFSMPESVEVIEDSAFYSCSLITSIELKANVKEVGFDAFGDCTALKTIFMYPELLHIADYAFGENHNIELVLYSGTEVAWNELLKQNKNTGLEEVAVFFRYRPGTMYAPDYIEAAQTTDSITVTWSKINGVTGYRLYMKNDKNWKTIETLKDTTYKVKGLKAGTKYSFAVKAYISSGAFVLWSTEYTTIDTATKAVKPSKVTAVRSNDKVELTWSASPGATGYCVYQKSGNSWKEVLNTGKTKHTFDGAKASGEYTYYVQPYIETESDVIWSDRTQVTAFDKTVKPAKITAKQTITTITLSWSKVTGATGYRVYKYNSKTKKYEYLKSTTGTSLKIIDLKSGTKYKFKIRAYVKNSGTVYGQYSSVLETSTRTKTPSNITASQTITTITLKWSKVSEADYYRVYKYNSKTKKYEFIKSTTETKLKITDLKSGTGYKYKVRAVTKAGDLKIFSDFSPEFATATKTKTPSISSIYSKTKGKAVVKWNNVSGESGFQLYYATSKDGTYKKVKSYEANKLAGSKTKLKSGKKYYFKVRAYKKTSSGTVYSSWSAVKSVRVK